MSKFKIDKGIEFPSNRGDRARKYPFPSMEVGDSFFFEGDPGKIRWASHNWGRVNGGKKFSVLKTENGFRCWRIK